MTFLIAGESPIRVSCPWRASLRRRRSLRAENSRQRFTATTIRSALNGFSKKSKAPIFTASAAWVSVAFPEMKIVGTSKPAV